MRRARVVLALAAVVAFAVLGGMHLGSAQSAPKAKTATTVGCSFKNGIQHVIYLQFDNTHLFPDRPPDTLPILLGLSSQVPARSGCAFIKCLEQGIGIGQSPGQMREMCLR